MRFVEGATLLRALITSESSDDTEVLVERAEEIRSRCITAHVARRIT